MMQAHAHQEALTAQHLKADMRHVQTVTDQLRGNLNLLEGQAELGEREREAVRARRAALVQAHWQPRGTIATETGNVNALSATDSNMPLLHRWRSREEHKLRLGAQFGMS